MEHHGQHRSRFGLEEHGIREAASAWWNLTPASLYEQSIRREEGQLAHGGPLVVLTGKCTGRSPNDKYVVETDACREQVWWGKGTKPMSPETYASLRSRMMSWLEGKELFVQDCYAGTTEEYRLPIRVINTHAWQNLFALNMFVREDDPAKLEAHTPQFTVIDAPDFVADPETDGTSSEVFVILNFDRREVLIGGTHYGGEMKKSILTVMTYLLPPQGVLPMHCSANYGDGPEDLAIFFGLSGTGKTTLSADPNRTLIGDDEHGWSDGGVFNFEGGCYAKVIRLSREGEPEIYETTRMFGTILENVVMDPATRRLDLDSDKYTENTRASYPTTHIPNTSTTGAGGQPRAILMLTADAFGVLPPIARLSPEQAMYHFLSGYTAKVAGTERGVTEPQATFSACFGAPFMARRPSVYAALLGEKIAERDVDVWLVNTGWSGGPYGVGERMNLAHTRAMVQAALDGSLADVSTTVHPVFGVRIPTSCPGVPAEVLDPRATWSDKEAYDAQARKLATMFDRNFEQFRDDVSQDIRSAAPTTA